MCFDSMHGFWVEWVARLNDGGREGEGGVVMYEDRKGESGEGWRRLDGCDSFGDGGREGEVEAVSCETTALIESFGLEVAVEGRTGLDEGRARDGVEEEEEGEGIDVGGVGVRVVNRVHEGA